MWIALDPLTVGANQNDASSHVQAGSAATLKAGGRVDFHAGDEPARIILVVPKKTRQDLTVESLSLSGNIEDASDQNETLLVAISNCRFQDTRNLGDESEWRPSRPSTLDMKSGSVRWVRPGMHHFKGLSCQSKLIFIEW